jgi:phage FluMu protein Com
MSDADLNDKQPSDQICFNCSFCGRQIRVPSVHAGKKGKCPKCKSVIVVPQAESAPARPDIGKSDPFPDILLQPATQPECIEAPQPDLTKEQQFDVLRQSAGLTSLMPEPPPKRTRPWLIDIFLYPANRQGLIFFAIAILIPLAIQLLCMLVFRFVGLLAVIVALPGGLISFIIGMYVYWFLAQCIRDSATGGIRVQDTTAETPGLWEILWQLVKIIACLVVYLVPAYFCHRFTHRTDLPFWLLLGVGVFLYPMALLGVIMFDSFNGLNPIIIIPSIFSTFFQYCGLVVLIGAIIFLVILTQRLLFINLLFSLLLYPVLQAIDLYMALIAAHLLGRFYFNYQGKLNWEV